jgi:MFS family permease
MHHAVERYQLSTWDPRKQIFSYSRDSKDCRMPHTATDSAQDVLFRRIGWRLMPILFTAYIAAYIDRVNVGFAKLQMLGDLKFSNAIYGLGAGIFFLGYFLFEVPSNLILHKIGARVWISRLLVTWGLVSACTALVRTPWQFYSVRFLLGVAESGFFPGMVLYLTYWFPSQRRAKMVALLMAGIPVSGVIGGPLSGYILNRLARSHGLAGWQSLFLIEAIPAVALGIMIFLRLDDRVAAARWLSEEEKQRIATEITADAPAKTHHTIRSVFTSPQVWLLGVIFFGIEMGSYAIGFWLPTIIRRSGVKSDFDIGLLTMAPYTLALISMILVGRHADKTGERRWHVVAPCLLAVLGFLVCGAFGGNTIMAMLGLILATVGVISALPVFFSLPTSFLGGAAAAAGIAFVNCIGNLGGFVSPTLIGLLTSHTGSLESGLFLVAGCMVVSSTLIITLLSPKLVNH